MRPLYAETISPASSTRLRLVETCCPACTSQIQQLTDDLERLGEGFAIDNVQCLELTVCREENQQLRSILEACGIPYG